MAEPISAARLAWIRDTYGDDHPVIGDLLAEIDRLHTEDPMVTAMNEWLVKLKKITAMWACYSIAGLVVFPICTQLLGLPSWAAVMGCFAAGGAIGVVQALVEDKQETRHGG